MSDIQKTYLGDGLYAEFDGYMLTLKANSADHPSDTVFIEPAVWNALVKFIKQMEEGQS
jgi:hypothetical protein